MGIVYIFVIVIILITFYILLSKQNLLSSQQSTQDTTMAVFTDIKEIEDNSERRINAMMGGMYDPNTSNVKSSNSVSTVHRELQLYYNVSCTSSTNILDTWYNVIKSLPQAQDISYKEFNYDKLMAQGIKLNNITKLPTLQLTVKPKSTHASDSDTGIITYEYIGDRSYASIKAWLANYGIQLKYNIKMEMFTDDIDPELLSLTDDIEAVYNSAYLAAAGIDVHGNPNDVKDGCYEASFSKCTDRRGTSTPGYQVFTHRGQYGCVYPDKNSAINTDFDAAFTAVDNYLQSCSPTLKWNPATEKYDIEISKDDQLKQMGKCATKYVDQLNEFGLCNREELDKKRNIPLNIRTGTANVPMSSMTADSYNDMVNSANAIHYACFGVDNIG